MLYHLFEWFRAEGIRFPGVELFRFITFRVLVAVILSLFITTVYGKRLIRYLQKKQIGESVRDLGLAGEQSKKGTPTMGGIIIILAIIILGAFHGLKNRLFSTSNNGLEKFRAHAKCRWTFCSLQNT